MKHLLMTILLFGTFGASAIAASPDPQELSGNVSASFGEPGYFYGPLSTYGEWLEVDPGFFAWRPRHVQYGWRPYLNGHWSWTDFGWYWVSSEPFGWAVFHYGRWYDDDYYGWIWVPDRTWGPAWVEWRYNDDYLGWAPLPPYASFSINMGIRFTTRWLAPYHYWSFVRYRHFTSPSIIHQVLPREYARRLMGTTRSAGRYDFDGDRIINRGVDRGIVERRGGNTRIVRTDVRESGSVGERVIRDRNQERLEVYRPDRSSIVRTPERIEARRTDRGTSLDLQKVERAPRESGRTTEPRGSERARGITREENQPPPQSVQQPETQRPREESIQRPRVEIRKESPKPPSVQQREIERRREDRYPFQRREQAQQQPERRVVIPERTQQQERRVVAPERSQQQKRQAVTPERSQQQERREIAQPRTRVEQSRPTPSIRQQSPRGTEQGRRESGKKRD